MSLKNMTPSEIENSAAGELPRRKQTKLSYLFQCLTIHTFVFLIFLIRKAKIFFICQSPRHNELDDCNSEPNTVRMIK
jgi:hypothetical protein